MKKTTSKKVSKESQEKLLATLKERFADNMKRHKGLVWEKVEGKLKASPSKLWSLGEMERTGGEPDVVGFDKKTGEFVFMDCSEETPKGRRSCSYDHAAQKGRKQNAPETNALDMAATMGTTILNEKEYRALQKLGSFDMKTSSWVETPANIRELGGALFCDYRYETVFVYHNGADSYYAARGFRTSLRV